MDNSINRFDRNLQYIVLVDESTSNMCQFLTAGDFSARTSNLPDYVEDVSDNHVYVIPEDYLEYAPMASWSKDTGTNQYGPYLLDFSKQSGLRIFNSKMGQDSEKA